jgi:signal transduction histidine kinase
MALSSGIILNVDDNEPARYVKRRILLQGGFDVHDAGTGKDALDLVGRIPFDLALLDVNLPDISGIDVCRKVKSRTESASVIVLQISASATAAYQASAALDSGADAYLTEPVDAAVLISTIKALLRLRKAEQALSVANERLTVMNHELHRSNEDLQQFAFAASHDLQEPLRTVTSFASLLERSAGPKLSEDERDYLKFIGDGMGRMRALIGDLLEYSQVGHKPDSSQPVDLNAVLAWALDNLRDGIAHSGAQVTSDPLPKVIGDEGQLGQVFQNLISNAIKYARPDVTPSIHVKVDQTEQECIVRIVDNGIGISPSHRELIFSPFKRLHGREIPGTGIGLAVCRKVIEAHGGKIWVESVPGEGSTFSFSVPCA